MSALEVLSPSTLESLESKVATLLFSRVDRQWGWEDSPFSAAIGSHSPLLISFRPVTALRVLTEDDDKNSSQRSQRSAAMASACDICGKGPGFGNNVSHSQVKTRRRWNPNIQRVRTLVGGSSKRQNVCTSCLKAGKVTR